MPSRTTISPGPWRSSASSDLYKRQISRSGTILPTRRSGIRHGLRVPAGEEVEECHPDRHAVRHLLGDHAPVEDRHVRRDLHALVHRPRVHHERGRLRNRETLARQPEPRRVLAQRWEEPGVHPLALETKGHHDVGVAERGVHVRGDGEAGVSWRAAAGPAAGPGVEAAQDRRGRADPEVRTGRGERPHVGTRDPRVEDVAEDHDLLPADVAEAVSYTHLTLPTNRD